MKNLSQISNRLTTGLYILEEIKEWFDPDQQAELAKQIIEIEQAICKAIKICDEIEERKAIEPETAEKLLAQFNKTYKELDDKRDNLPDFRDTVNWFDANCSKEPVKTILSDFIKLRLDFISSDREAAAFTYAIHELNLI